MNSRLVLRLTLTVVLLSHSLPGMIDGSIYGFGHWYLDKVGFSPFGVLLAWLIKLSHVIAALCFLFNTFIRPAALFTILILLVGIVMVHAKEGWFVVGGGRNGMEYNVVLMAMMIALLLPGSDHKLKS